MLLSAICRFLPSGLCAVCVGRWVYILILLSLSFCLPVFLSSSLSPLSSSQPVFYFALIFPSIPPFCQAPWCHSPCACCMPSFPNTWPRPKRLSTACTIWDLSASLLVHPQSLWMSINICIVCTVRTERQHTDKHISHKCWSASVCKQANVEGFLN